MRVHRNPVVWLHKNQKYEIQNPKLSRAIRCHRILTDTMRVHRHPGDSVYKTQKNGTQNPKPWRRLDTATIWGG